MHLVHVSTSAMTFFHRSVLIRRDDCWTVKTFQRVLGLVSFFPLTSSPFPLSQSSSFISFLSIRNHLELILTLW